MPCMAGDEITSIDNVMFPTIHRLDDAGGWWFCREGLRAARTYMAGGEVTSADRAVFPTIAFMKRVGGCFVGGVRSGVLRGDSTNFF